MGRGEVSRPIPSRTPERVETIFRLPVEDAKEAERYELQTRMKRIETETAKMMRQAKDNVDPNINDHGAGHIQRVLSLTNEVQEIFDEVSLTRTQINRLQDEREKFDLGCATLMHDVGRTEGLKGPHSIQSGKIIDSRKDLFPDIRQRERISKLAILHGKEGSQSLGSDDISELERKGVLNRREALQASIIRIADALDVGKRRVDTNTQGEPAHKVIDRLQRMPDEKGKSYLRHWYGHRGITIAEPYNDNGKFGIRIKLDPEYLRSNGTDVAFVANDILSDVNSTVVGRNYTTDFKCAEKRLARDWYRNNQGIFGEETTGVNVIFTQAYD